MNSFIHENPPKQTHQSIRPSCIHPCTHSTTHLSFHPPLHPPINSPTYTSFVWLHGRLVVVSSEPFFRLHVFKNLDKVPNNRFESFSICLWTHLRQKAYVLFCKTDISMSRRLMAYTYHLRHGQNVSLSLRSRHLRQLISRISLCSMILNRTIERMEVRMWDESLASHYNGQYVYVLCTYTK